MTIGFEELSYVVGEEEQSVSVCVVLTGQTALGISVSTQGIIMLCASHTTA